MTNALFHVAALIYGASYVSALAMFLGAISSKPFGLAAVLIVIFSVIVPISGFYLLRKNTHEESALSTKLIVAMVYFTTSFWPLSFFYIFSILYAIAAAILIVIAVTAVVFRFKVDSPVERKNLLGKLNVLMAVTAGFLNLCMFVAVRALNAYQI